MMFCVRVISMRLIKRGKICYKFPFYHLFIEPEDEHGGIDASNQQSQHEGK